MPVLQPDIVFSNLPYKVLSFQSLYLGYIMQVYLGAKRPI